VFEGEGITVLYMGSERVKVLNLNLNLRPIHGKSLHCSVVSMSGCIAPIMDENLYKLLRVMAMQKRRQPNMKCNARRILFDRSIDMNSRQRSEHGSRERWSREKIENFIYGDDDTTE